MPFLIAALVALSVSAALQSRGATIYSTRATENGTPVFVYREPNPHAGSRLERYFDRRATKTYTAILLVSTYDYQFKRNCHDFAWAPFMMCMCNTAPPQKEAWWMPNPALNWLDGSMVNVATSAPLPAAGGEYSFTTATIQGLWSWYTNPFGDYILLPVSNLNAVNDTEVPEHSAVLFDIIPAATAGSSYGIYVSKWGNNGLYKHRWGTGFAPPEYMTKSTLRIFAPNWNGPYWITHPHW